MKVATGARKKYRGFDQFPRWLNEEYTQRSRRDKRVKFLKYVLIEALKSWKPREVTYANPHTGELFILCLNVNQIAFSLREAEGKLRRYGLTKRALQTCIAEAIKEGYMPREARPRKYAPAVFTVHIEKFYQEPNDTAKFSKQHTLRIHSYS